MPLVRVFTTCRFSLREAHAGMRRSNLSRATSIDVSLQLSGDLSDLVRLDDVAFLDVVEVRDPDTALEPLTHLADVVLEAAERADPAGVRNDAVADDPGTRVPDDRALQDVRAGDQAHLRDAEHGTDLGPTELRLALLGLEHPAQGAADVIDRVVDHAVEPDVDAFLLGEIARLHVGTDVEPYDDRPGCQRQVDVALGDRPGGAPDHVDPHLVLRQLGERVHERPDRALHVRLHDQIQLGDLVAFGLRHQLLQGRRARRHHLGRPELGLPFLHDVARRAFVLDLADVVASVGGRGPAEDLHRLAGTRLLHLLPVLVEHRADPRPRRARDDRVADVECASLDEHARNRPAALVQVRLEHDTTGAT